MKTLRRWILGLAATTLVAAGAGVAALWHLSRAPLLERGTPVRITVESGMRPRAVGRALQIAGVFDHPRVFAWIAKYRNQAERIQAGVYEVTPGMTVTTLLDRMARGESLQDSVTLVEGWVFRQMRAALDAHPNLRHDTAPMSDREIMERVGAIETEPEGLFFPDSYRFGVGSSDVVILRKAYAKMRDVLEKSWHARVPDLPVTSPYEALVLASIVEKETGKPEDRPQIAAVFVNRLRIGMRLQSDPTVIYGMGTRFDGNLRREDLDTDTPFNTYTRNGLPPTPIAAPGAAALSAVLNPPPSRALYFVARGDGTSEFSATLEDHNRAVARYQKR